MEIEVTINNYVLGAKVKSTPTDKIISQERVDRNHTRIVYSGITQREKDFIEKVLSSKTTIISDIK